MPSTMPTIGAAPNEAFDLAVHEVRVVAVPPAVDEPTAHVAQLLAPAALNLESAPHCVCMLLPSHEW